MRKSIVGLLWLPATLVALTVVLGGWTAKNTDPPFGLNAPTPVLLASFTLLMVNIGIQFRRDKRVWRRAWTISAAIITIFMFLVALVP
jgi:hypothetical protein